jgi:hypothetical protein
MGVIDDAMPLRALPTVLFALLFLCTCLLQASPASACSCARPPDARTALDRSHAVFTGQVISVNETIDWSEFSLFSGPVMKHFEVVFEVKSAWKGVDETQVSIFTEGWAGGCGIPFQPGTKYLIYASYWEKNQLETNICTRTTELVNAEEDLQALGPGSPPSKATNLALRTSIIFYDVIGVPLSQSQLWHSSSLKKGEDVKPLYVPARFFQSIENAFSRKMSFPVLYK